MTLIRTSYRWHFSESISPFCEQDLFSKKFFFPIFVKRSKIFFIFLDLQLIKHKKFLSGLVLTYAKELEWSYDFLTEGRRVSKLLLGFSVSKSIKWIGDNQLQMSLLVLDVSLLSSELLKIKFFWNRSIYLSFGISASIKYCVHMWLSCNFFMLQLIKKLTRL